MFGRTAHGCSVPREGAHTLGMDGRHSHYERRHLGQDEDSPHVRRKLFSIQAATEPEEEEARTGDERREERVGDVAWAQRLVPPTSTGESVTPKVVYTDYRRSIDQTPDSDSDDAITFPTPAAPLATPKCPAQTSAFKRTLSRAHSQDFFTRRERKSSVSNPPLAKTLKPEVLETPTTTRTEDSSQKSLVKTRSSSRLTGKKSLQVFTSSNCISTDPSSLLTPKSWKGPTSLSKAFTTTNLKVQSSVSATPSELPKPNRKLASSITTSCLKSFHNYHVSPESKAVDEPSEDEELPVPRPKFERTDSKKFVKPEVFILERGSSAGKKKSKKKGVCGTRGGWGSQTKLDCLLPRPDPPGRAWQSQSAQRQRGGAAGWPGRAGGAGM